MVADRLYDFEDEYLTLAQVKEQLRDEVCIEWAEYNEDNKGYEWEAGPFCNDDVPFATEQQARDAFNRFLDEELENLLDTDYFFEDDDLDEDFEEEE